MDYLETLRRNGWLCDPGERLRVVAVHAKGCLANWGRPCSCDPRLRLVVDPFIREARLIDNDLPTLDIASGESSHPPTQIHNPRCRPGTSLTPPDLAQKIPSQKG